MVRPDNLLIGWVGVQARLEQALRLVHHGTNCKHLRFDGVAEVRGLCTQIVRLLFEERLQLVVFGLDANVDIIALASKRRHRNILGHVLGASRQDARLHHVHERGDLDVQGRRVVLEHHFRACITFLVREHTHAFEELLGLGRVEGREGHRRGVQVRQPALLGLHGPLRRVAITSEDHVAVLLEHLRHGITMAHASLDER
mmetsp:Transcript_5563/g.16469  ORF Transcript_5563/g.16469 Transcript_5563/m.16469 type:complete len:200 (+) Transcript_5563:220-819(+)